MAVPCPAKLEICPEFQQVGCLKYIWLLCRRGISACRPKLTARFLVEIFLEERKKCVCTPKSAHPLGLGQQELLVMVRGKGLAVARFGGPEEWWVGGRVGIVPWMWPRINSVNKAVNKQRMSICPDFHPYLPVWRQLPATWPWFPVSPEGRVTTKAGALGACNLSDF